MKGQYQVSGSKVLGFLQGSAVTIYSYLLPPLKKKTNQYPSLSSQVSPRTLHLIPDPSVQALPGRATLGQQML